MDHRYSVSSIYTFLYINSMEMICIQLDFGSQPGRSFYCCGNKRRLFTVLEAKCRTRLRLMIGNSIEASLDDHRFQDEQSLKIEHTRQNKLS